MKNLLKTFVFTGLAMAGIAQADSQEIRLSLNGEKTPFQTLSELYQNAEEATLEDLKGFWSGRCFDKWSKRHPLNSMLVAAQPASEGGPLFEPDRLVFEFHDDNKADHYDEFNPWDHFSSLGPKAIYQNILERYRGREFAVSMDKDGTDYKNIKFTFDYEPNGRIDERSTFRKYNSFIVMKKANLINNNEIYSRSKEEYKKGVPAGTIEYCYYFKKLDTEPTQ